MKKQITFLFSLFIGIICNPFCLMASGVSDSPGLIEFDTSCDTASAKEGFLWALELTGTVDPGYSVEGNIGVGFRFSREFGASLNAAGGVYGWEDDVTKMYETFFYGIAGGKIFLKLDWFSIAGDIRFRFADSTDAITSPEPLFPSLLLGFGREEFLTLGFGGQGISAVFHWKILHIGIFYQPKPFWSDFDDFGLKIALGRY